MVADATRGRRFPPPWSVVRNSLVKAEHVLDGIQNGCVGVAVAIKAYFLLIVVDCSEIDDRAVALAVVVSAKPQHDVVRGRRELLP